jgi:hypothetical protein
LDLADSEEKQRSVTTESLFAELHPGKEPSALQSYESVLAREMAAKLAAHWQEIKLILALVTQNGQGRFRKHGIKV